MKPEDVFGKSAYYLDEKTDPCHIGRLLNYGVQQIGVGILFLDVHRKCVYANKHAFNMLHSEANLDSVYKAFTDWMSSLGIEQSSAAWCRVFENHDKERLYKVRYRYLLDDDNKPIGHMYTIQNLSDIVENGTGEQYRLTHDELTSLYNREGFSQATQALLRDTEKTYLLLYSNIKDFKLFNQLFGLDKGNDILINIADMIM